ncbi:alpha/beta fold hydrolase [Pelagibius marinus]|uniref:alpha/beta fold hydrolase n=1 Tax=Pelagibius marinus TaxID=2762760 RepID=UPI001872A632|nr:alpha/beta hydrolase [Pelagibius marinus]
MSGLPVFAYDTGPESDLPPLLLIHGLLSSREHWLPNRALSKVFRIIRVDLPAHGASPTLEEPEAARPEAMVRALDILRCSLGIPRWHICGQSFGAGLSLRYALDYPDRCIAQIFTNANAALRRHWPPDAQAAHRDLVAALWSGGPTAIRRIPYHPVHARRFSPEIRKILSIEADKVDPGGYALLQQEAIPRLFVCDRLGELRVPTLLVNGLKERRFQPTRDWLAATHPEISITDLDGGHSINIENPAEFNQAVSSFLQDHGP